MAGGVGRNVEHVEADVERVDAYRVAFDQRLIDAVDVFLEGPEYRYRVPCQQGIEAADMIGMVVRDKNGGKLQRLAIEVVQHGPGVARIHHDCVTAIVHQPDVVIAEGGKRDNVHPRIVRA